MNEAAWMALGPIFVKLITDLISKTAFWAHIDSQMKRLIPVTLSGAWCGLYSLTAILGAGGSVKEAVSVFLTALLGIVIHDIQKGVQKKNSKKKPTWIV